MQPKINKKRKEKIISLDGPSAIEKRQNKLNSDYQNIICLSQKRGKALGEATNLFKFFAECTDFEQWTKITGQNLQEPLNQEHLPALQKKFQVKFFLKLCEEREREYWGISWSFSLLDFLILNDLP